MSDCNSFSISEIQVVGLNESKLNESKLIFAAYHVSLSVRVWEGKCLVSFFKFVYWFYFILSIYSLIFIFPFRTLSQLLSQFFLFFYFFFVFPSFSFSLSLFYLLLSLLTFTLFLSLITFLLFFFSTFNSISLSNSLSLSLSLSLTQAHFLSLFHSVSQIHTYTLYLSLSLSLGGPRGVVANVLNCCIVKKRVRTPVTPLLYLLY